MNLDLLRSRAQWYRDGCDGLEDVDGYLREGLAADAAGDLDTALAIIADLQARLATAEAWQCDGNAKALDQQSQKQWWQSRCERAEDENRGLLSALSSSRSREQAMTQERDAAMKDATILQEQIDQHYIPRVVEAEGRYDMETGKLGNQIGELRSREQALREKLERADLWRKDRRPRSGWELLEERGLCPECGQRACDEQCRKRFFDWAYGVGYHDGANNLERHLSAFVDEMMDAGLYATVKEPT